MEEPLSPTVSQQHPPPPPHQQLYRPVHQLSTFVARQQAIALNPRVSWVCSPLLLPLPTRRLHQNVVVRMKRERVRRTLMGRRGTRVLLEELEDKHEKEVEKLFDCSLVVFL